MPAPGTFIRSSRAPRAKGGATRPIILPLPHDAVRLSSSRYVRAAVEVSRNGDGSISLSVPLMPDDRIASPVASGHRCRLIRERHDGLRDPDSGRTRSSCPGDGRATASDDDTPRVLRLSRHVVDVKNGDRSISLYFSHPSPVSVQRRDSELQICEIAKLDLSPLFPHVGTSERPSRFREMGTDLFPFPFLRSPAIGSYRLLLPATDAARSVSATTVFGTQVPAGLAAPVRAMTAQPLQMTRQRGCCASPGM